MNESERVAGRAGRRPLRTRRAVRAIVLCSGLALAGIPAVAAAQGGPSGCAAAAVGQVSCAALATSSATAMTQAAVDASGTAPPGYSPVQLRDAYGLEYQALTGGVGQTVAVVTEYGDTTAEADMATYRSEYSLPACGSGCFSVVDENGGTNYPPAGPTGWTLADAQSLDIISAICPNCHILLVEAGTTTDGSTTAGITDLGAAENTAVSLGADFITNTWYTQEATYGTSEPTYDSEYFNHPGVAITAPDGNGAGYGTYYPAASPDVIAVGGTTLTADPSSPRGWTETVWNGTGSGCSPYEAKPSWQTDTGCTTRMLNDVSAVADPTGSPVASFDTSSGGWVEGGGNDVSSALVAAAFALAGTPAAGTYPASYLYAHTGAGLINDITSGSNGTCTTAYFCTAGTGYDGPAGVGTPASAAALGAMAPAASMPAGPVTYNAVTGDEGLYVPGTNGTAWQDSWNAASGWSSANLGGDIAGRPAAVLDPASGNLEVYAGNAAGHIYEDYQTPAGAWEGWEALTGTPSTEGSPAAIYSPLNGSLDVFATATTGAVYENSWSSADGWTGWQGMNGTLASGPDAVYDPASGAVDVYGINSAGHMYEDSWTPAAGWSGWSALSGDYAAGTPSAVYDPLGGNLEIYAQDSGGTVTEIYQAPDGSWYSTSTFGGSAIEGNPVAVYDPVGGSPGGDLEVYATTTAGTPVEDHWAPGQGWSGWVSLGGTIVNGPDAVYDLASGALEVYGINSSGHIYEDSWTPAAGWSGWKGLSGTAGDL